MRSFGPDSKQSWVVAVACFVIQIMAFGLVEVSGLFFVATIPRFKTKRELASLPYTLTYCVRSALGPLIGYLGCRFGIRQVSLAGCVLSVIAVGACFFVDDIIWLIILWGICFGFTLGLETSLLNVIINEHFVKNRVKANGLNAAGASIGVMILTPVISYLIEDTYGLSGTFLIMSGLMLHSITAAIIIMLNKPEPHGADNPTYTSDIESVLKVRKSLAPAIEVKMEKRFSSSDLTSKTSQNRALNEGIDENGADNSDANTKPPLVLMHAVQCNDLSNERIFSYRCRDEIKLRSKSGGDMSIVTDFQKENDRLNDECYEMRSVASTQERSRSLFLDSNQLDNIPENVARKSEVVNRDDENSGAFQNDCRSTTLEDHDSVEPSNRNNLKSIHLDSITCSTTFENGQNVEVMNNEMPLQLSRDENQSTVTSLSELSKTAWKNGGTCVYNHLELESNPIEKNMTSNLSAQIPDIKVTSENGKSVLNSSVDDIENYSKWHIYRLACEPVYLLLVIGSGIYYFAVTTFLTIIVDYATDIGLSITYSTYILMWVGTWDIIAYATLGYIIERGYFTQSKFACLSYLGMCLTSAAMVWAPSYIVLLFIIALFEFSQAGVIILSAPLVAELIDPDLQATAIASVTLLSAPVSLAISPLIGFFRDGSGSYTGLFHVISASTFVSCLLFLCIPKVKQRLKS